LSLSFKFAAFSLSRKKVSALRPYSPLPRRKGILHHGGGLNDFYRLSSQQRAR